VVITPSTEPLPAELASVAEPLTETVRLIDWVVEPVSATGLVPSASSPLLT
jgi:hypothetical protein